MSDNRLIDIKLDRQSFSRGSADVEHERSVAIYDLIEKNYFKPCNQDGGPYKLILAVQEGRLAISICDENENPLINHILSLTPLRKIIRDYFIICESYYDAIKTMSPSQIESIDMGRRGLHNEGSEILLKRLEGKIEVDFDTARRLFTLICVLHWKG